MPDPIPFPEHRRAAPPSGAGQPAGQSPPKQPVPAVHQSNVVSLADRRPKAVSAPPIILWPWWL